MNRPEILDTAKKCVCGQREQDYGKPEDNFNTIGLLWGVYLRAAHPNLAKVMGVNGITPQRRCRYDGPFESCQGRNRKFPGHVRGSGWLRSVRWRDSYTGRNRDRCRRSEISAPWVKVQGNALRAKKNKTISS